MAKLIESAALAISPDFLNSVTAAAQRVAAEKAESIPNQEDGPGPKDKNRWLLCQAVFSDPAAYGARFAWAVASLEFIDKDADDATLVTQVNNLWDVFANVPIG